MSVNEIESCELSLKPSFYLLVQSLGGCLGFCSSMFSQFLNILCKLDLMVDIEFGIVTVVVIEFVGQRSTKRNAWKEWGIFP